MQDKRGKELSSEEIIRKILNRIYNILLELGIFFLHIVGLIPSHHIRRFFYKTAGVRMGIGSTIHMGARFYEPGNIIIGDDSIVGEGVVLDGRDKLIIGDHVDIATEVMIYNSQHNVHAQHFAADEGVETLPVTIADYAFIGPRVIILPGVRIGKGAVVGAGAVVTKDVDDFEIVGGVPAKVIGERKIKNLHYKLGRARWFR